MDVIGKILATTDLSEASEVALPWAEMLATAFGAQVTVLCVQSPVPVEYAEFAAPAESLELEASRENAEKELRTVIGECLSEVEASIEVVQDSPAHASILNYADRGQFDLVVMATHGRTGLGHFLLGSITERILQHSKTPVLCIRSDSAPLSDNIKINRILCPTDLSDRSKIGIDAAVTLARVFHADLDVLHVDTSPGSPLGSIEIIHPDDRSLWELREQVVQMAPDHAEGISLHYHLMKGNVSRCINHFADENEDDLIVMTTHGHDAFGDFLLGSNTERVLRHSDHPIFVCPARP